MTSSLRPSFLGQWQTACDPPGYTKLYFVHKDKASHAFIVKAVDSGFVACLPIAALSDEDLAEALEEQFSGVFGPWTKVALRAVTASGKELASKSWPCLLVDLNASGIDMFSAALPDVGEVTSFGTHRLQSSWVLGSAAVTALETFLNGEELSVEAVERLEGYYTAASEAELDAVPLTSAPSMDGSILQQLLAQGQQQAQLLSGIQSRLNSLDELEARLSLLEGPPAGAGVGLLSGGTEGEKQPTWAPQLFNEGVKARLDQEQLKQLLALAGRGPKNLQDLPGPSRAPPRLLQATPKISPQPKLSFAVPTFDIGSEDAEEEKDDVGAGAEGSDAQILSKLLVQQTKILSQLTASATKSSDPLHLLGGSGGGGDDETKVAGVRGMAARQLLKEQFQKHPERVYQKVRERLAQARRKASPVDLEARDMFLHFQETVPLGNYKTLTYLAFLLCDAWEAIEQNRSADVCALISLGLIFCEQVANEQGHTRLAWLLTCREDPPFSIVEQRKAPRAEVPHGMLSDPRWVATQLGYLKDVDLIQDRTAKAHHPKNPNHASNQDEPPGGKGKRSGRGSKYNAGDGTA